MHHKPETPERRRFIYEYLKIILVGCRAWSRSSRQLRRLKRSRQKGQTGERTDPNTRAAKTESAGSTTAEPESPIKGAIGSTTTKPGTAVSGPTSRQSAAA